MAVLLAWRQLERPVHCPGNRVLPAPAQLAILLHRLLPSAPPPQCGRSCPLSTARTALELELELVLVPVLLLALVLLPVVVRVLAARHLRPWQALAGCAPSLCSMQTRWATWLLRPLQRRMDSPSLRWALP